MTGRCWLAIAAGLWISAAGVGAAEPLAAFECREKLGRDWPRTLVTYERQFPRGAARPGEVRLVDAAGVERPVQLWRVATHDDGSLASARVSFHAELGKEGSYRYELLAGRPGATGAAPTASADGPSTTLDNGIVAVRLPAAGEVRFGAALPMASDAGRALAARAGQGNAAVAPGPIQGVRLADGRWVGGSGLVAARPDGAPRVVGYTSRITEQGPLFVEAKVRYALSNGGWYELAARVLAGDPAVRIDEQFDTGAPGGMLDYRMVLALSSGGGQGWRPDSAYFVSPAKRLAGTDGRLVERLTAAGAPPPDECGSLAIEPPPPGDAQDKTLCEVAVRYPWHPNAHFLALVRTADLTRENLAAGKAPFLAVVPMHAGNWRGSADVSDGALVAHASGDAGRASPFLAMHWRLRASPHPRGMLHTGEYDPGQPPTFCRRQWALIGGPFQPYEKVWAFRACEGYVTLDDYKDWVLDWPADPTVTYPRLLFDRAHVERLKGRLGELPAETAEGLRKFLYFTESDERRQALWKGLTYDGEWSGPRGATGHLLTRGDPPNIPWAITYRISQMAGWAGDVDELLSSERLEPAQRQRLRTDLAAFCQLMAEPDVNPRGSMTHLGNPNMPINRFLGLAWAAALIPDHPMAASWLDLSAEYLRYKLATMTAPGGAWGELITYYDASAPHLIQTAGVLARTGRLDEATARLAVEPAIFTLNLLSPVDARFAARMTPGWGHEGMAQGIQFLVAANAVRGIDPELAAAFAWAWDQTGRPMTGHHDAGFSRRAQANVDLLARLPRGQAPRQLGSAWLPGFGAALRAHAGTPGETYLSYRQGYHVSHSDENQGDFTLYAGGAPLVPLSLAGYAIHGDGPFGRLFKTFGFHSRVRFGRQENTGGWPGAGAVGGVPAHGFSDSVDYVRGVSDEGALRWHRQIALLKSRSPAQPSYFVFRDSFAPLGAAAVAEPTWWYLRTAGSRGQVRATDAGLEHASPFGPRLDVRFLEPAKVRHESRDGTHRVPLYHVNADNWRRAHPGLSGEGNLHVEDTLTVNAFGPIAAGQDVLVALFPHAQGEPPPRYEALGGGAARITTAESVDHVFLDRRPMRFAADDVRFEGMAGAVRIYEDEVHLVISEGPGVAGYRGTTLRSEGPALKVVRKADLERRQAFEVPSPWKLPKRDLPPGCRVEGPARCEVTIEADRIAGRSEGFGGLLYAPMPPGMKVLPRLVIDGRSYAPGTSGGTLIIPLVPGEHTFEVRPLEQPPVFRNWQAW